MCIFYRMKPIYFENEKFSPHVLYKIVAIYIKRRTLFPFENYYQQVRKQKYEKTFKN